MYAIRYSSEAAKTINRLPVNLRRLIAEKVKSLAVAPHDRQPQVKALKGEFKGLWRLRVGAWRVFYALDDERRALSVIYVRKREDAYD